MSANLRLMGGTGLRGILGLFSGCSEAEWRAIEAIVTERTVYAGEILFHQGESCAAFYYLVEGTVKLCLRLARGERVIEFVSAGNPLGESALFAGEGYPVTAVAIEDSKTLSFPAFPFLRLAQTYPNLALRVLGRVSRQYHRQLNRQVQMVEQSADQKVASYLLDHCIENSYPYCAELPPRRIDLANLLNITPETLCRVVKRFKESEWIECKGNRAILRNPRALRNTLQEPDLEASDARSGVPG